MQYKGIELEGLDKDVKLAHSRFIETDEGTDWIDKLRSVDKQTLTHIQFHEVSALNSVINMDYQICNGGLSQYFCNGYDCYRKPCHEQDVEQLDKEAQCDRHAGGAGHVRTRGIPRARGGASRAAGYAGGLA